jgi:protein-disulfide isomerase
LVGAGQSHQDRHVKRLQIVVTAAVVAVLLVAGLAVIVTRDHLIAGRATMAGTNRPDHIRVTSDRVVTAGDTTQPKVVLSLYEDFLCPHCRRFEETFGVAVNELIDQGVAVDYVPVAILDWAGQNYSSRAGGAAFCVADQSIDTFRRFHAALFAHQPAETSTTMPTNDDIAETARQAGADGGAVADCIRNETYTGLVAGMADAKDVHSTPTVRINDEDYEFSTPDALIADVTELLR